MPYTHDPPGISHDDGVVGTWEVDDGICSYDDIVSDGDASEDNTASIDRDIVTDHGTTGVLRVAPTDSHQMTDVAVLTYDSILMDHNTYPPVVEHRTLADLRLSRDLAIVDQEDKQGDQLRKYRDMIPIQPMREPV